MPMPIIGLYAATKAFVISFSESLCYQEKSKGVYVMALCSGIMDTKFDDHSGGRSQQPPKRRPQQKSPCDVNGRLLLLY
jgi:short-subunit dehydrogenase